jgi:hypothetical protein
LEELNLVEFPLAVLSDYVPDGRKTLEFFDRIRDQESNSQLNRLVTITAADKWGLPNWQDQDVLLAMMVLSKLKNGFGDRRVRFTLHELRNLLRWPHNGTYNRRLQESLDRWTGVTIKYSHWRTKTGWKKSKAFHVIEWYALSMGRDFDVDEPQTFTWNELVFESFQANHTKPLDWEFYIGLKTPTAKRLYRFLDKRFFLKSRWAFDLAEFSENKLGLNKVTDIWRYKERLAPAIKELEAKGFLKPIGTRDRFAKVGKGKYDVIFERLGGRAAKTPSALFTERLESATPVASSDSSSLEGLLRVRGVTNAAELVKNFSAEMIERQLENFDDRLRHGEKLTAGWLRKAIETEGGYGFRKGFKSKAQHDAERRSLEVAQQKRNDEERNRLVLEQQDRAAAAARKQRVDKYLAKLSAIEVKALESAALAEASEERRSNYQSAKKFRLGTFLIDARYSLLEEYLVKREFIS